MMDNAVKVSRLHNAEMKRGFMKPTLLWNSALSARISQLQVVNEETERSWTDNERIKTTLITLQQRYNEAEEALAAYSSYNIIYMGFVTSRGPSLTSLYKPRYEYT